MVTVFLSFVLLRKSTEKNIVSLLRDFHPDDVFNIRIFIRGHQVDVYSS